MSAAWPAVAGWLLTTLPTLPGWSGIVVYDGEPDTGDSPTDFATVGFTTSGDVGGEFTEVVSDDGLFVNEQGHVYVDIACQSGDSDLATVRSRCFGLLDSLRAVVKADHTLGGVLSANGDVSIICQPLNIKNQAGVAQAIVVTFGYQTIVFDL
jgi:hypothetical protein